MRRVVFIIGEFQVSFVYAGRGRRGAAACDSRSRASGVGSLHRRAADCRRRRVNKLAGPARLTGLQAPFLQLDEARRLQQGVQEAHGGHGTAPARRRAVQARPLSRRDWPATRAARRSRGRRHYAPMAAPRPRHVTRAPGQWRPRSAGRARSMPLQRSNARAPRRPAPRAGDAARSSFVYLILYVCFRFSGGPRLIECWLLFSELVAGRAPAPRPAGARANSARLSLPRSRKLTSCSLEISPESFSLGKFGLKIARLLCLFGTYFPDLVYL